MSSTSDPEPLSPATTLSTDNLTYGIKLEFVFAFHEDLIRFPSDAQHTVVKRLPYSTRRLQKFSRVNPVLLPNRVHTSWILNPWKGEPLQIVANTLRGSIPAFAGPYLSGRLNVLDTLDSNAKKQLNWDNKQQWHIAEDYSVCSVRPRNLQRWLPGKEIRADTWDSLGVEIISPFLDSNTPRDVDRIGEIVEALRKDAPQTGSFITNQCGLHVHVQGPSASQFQKELNMSKDDAERQKARVWAEFALILIVYEDETARLHPPGRRPGHPNAKYQIQSNRLGLMKEDVANIFPNNLVGPEIQTSIENCIGIDCSTSAISQIATIPNTRHGLNKYLGSDHVALVNWPRTACSGGTEKPYRDLGDKDRQVNMTYLIRKPNLPHTIEFRQAKGSLKGQDISRWVEFCIGLVRLAHLYAADPSRFRVRNWRDVRLPDDSFETNRIDVFDLMRDMNMGNEAITYWERKVATYKGYRHDDEHDRLDDELPPPEGGGDPGNDSHGPSSKQPRENEAGDIEAEKKRQKPDPKTAAAIADPAPPSVQRYYPIPTQVGTVDEYGYHCPNPDELLVFDEFGWKVLMFESNDWMRMDTSHLVTVPFGIDRVGVCPCNALVQAMKEQYPRSPYALAKAYDLLPIMDEVFGGTAIDITDDQFVQVLRRWTDGKFNLVYVSPAQHHRIARRTGTKPLQELWGQNLYVRHRPARVGRRDHWESLRKATEEERAANVTRSRAGISRGANFM